MEVTVQRDGLTLRGTLTTPKAATYDLVILMHGFTSDRGRQPNQLLYQLAQRLTTAGLATLRFDFNGHGTSDGKFQDMTVLNEIADGKAILDYAQQLPGVRHCALLGHSQGGVVASMLAGYYHDQIDKLMLLAPAATLKTDALKGKMQGFTYDPQHIPATLPIMKGLTLGGLYLRTAQTLPIYEVAQQYQGPVCDVHGLADQVVSPAASKRYADVYQHATLHLLPDVDHGFTTPTGRQQALDLATAFFTK